MDSGRHGKSPPPLPRFFLEEELRAYVQKEKEERMRAESLELIDEKREERKERTRDHHGGRSKCGAGGYGSSHGSLTGEEMDRFLVWRFRWEEKRDSEGSFFSVWRREALERLKRRRNGKKVKKKKKMLDGKISLMMVSEVYIHLRDPLCRHSWGVHTPEDNQSLLPEHSGVHTPEKQQAEEEAFFNFLTREQQFLLSFSLRIWTWKLFFFRLLMYSFFLISDMERWMDECVTVYIEGHL